MTFHICVSKLFLEDDLVCFPISNDGIFNIQSRCTYEHRKLTVFCGMSKGMGYRKRTQTS